VSSWVIAKATWRSRTSDLTGWAL